MTRAERGPILSVGLDRERRLAEAMRYFGPDQHARSPWTFRILTPPPPPVVCELDDAVVRYKCVCANVHAVIPNEDKVVILDIQVIVIILLLLVVKLVVLVEEEILHGV